MKTNIVSLILISVFIAPALAIHTEVGIYYGISVAIPDSGNKTGIVASQIPSGSIDIGTGETSLYVMCFFREKFSAGLEMSAGIFSVFDDTSNTDTSSFSLSSFTSSAQVAYYLRDYYSSSPYLLGRISQAMLNVSDYSFYQDDFEVVSFGVGVGYQYLLKRVFLIRSELRYHRMISEPKRDFSDAFSLVFGFNIGY